jgi:hypothetical protein
MKAEVAVATVQGKAYFLIVNGLKESNIDFISLFPGETVPAEVKVVITTDQEKSLVNHEKALVFREESDLEKLMSEVTRILLGKEVYEKIVVGIDPGDVFGLAVIADGKVIDRANCFSLKEVLSKVLSIIKNIKSSATQVSIKIGNGVPAYKELVEALDDALPPEVVLEIVGEAGTNRPSKKAKRSRGIRHIASALRIAGRVGYIHLRRKTN